MRKPVPPPNIEFSRNARPPKPRREPDLMTSLTDAENALDDAQHFAAHEEGASESVVDKINRALTLVGQAKWELDRAIADVTRADLEG